jgi:replicative DNA helicase
MDELTKLTDTEAEMLVIGSLLMDTQYTPDVRAFLRAEDFTAVDYRHIYRAMMQLADRGLPTDDIWLVLVEWESLGDKPKPSVLAECASLPTACHARHYAERVHDLAERRRMLREAQQIAGAALDITKPIIKGSKGGVAQV